MRSPLLYLTITKFRNQLKSFFRSPGKIIYVVVLAALLIFSVVGGNAESVEEASYADIRILWSGVFALLTVMFVLSAYSGFSRGASFFTMSDVNFIFPSPLKQERVLFYGLLRQLSSSLLIGVFLVFQYAWMHNTFGIGGEVILILILVYALNLFAAQVTAMLLYTFTNGNENRRKFVKSIFIALYALLAAYIFVSILPTMSSPLPKLLEIACGPVIQWFPINGWLFAIFHGFVEGNFVMLAGGIILCAVYITLSYVAVVKLKNDYYEDVLKSAEINHSAITASKQGRTYEALPDNIKVGKTGIGNGFGANAFYYKHLVENRRSQIIGISKTQLIMAVISIVLSIILNSVGGLIAVVAASTYVQLFVSSIGRFTSELSRPYIYLIPESPFKKLWNSLRESFLGFVIQAFLIFIPVMLIAKLSPIETIAAIAVRISFSMLFLAGNIVVQRLFGSMTSRTLTFFFYFLMLLLVCVPGIIAAVFLAPVLPFETAVSAMLVISACNVPMSALLLLLCRNVLVYCELNN